MKNYLQLLLLLLLCRTIVFAQDTIIYHNHNIVVGKIIDENESEIIYNKLENPGGPDYIEELKKIDIIKKGSKDFKIKQHQDGVSDTIIFKNGDTLTADVSEVSPKTIFYSKKDSVGYSMTEIKRSRLHKIIYPNGYEDAFGKLRVDRLPARNMVSVSILNPSWKYIIFSYQHFFFKGRVSFIIPACVKITERSGYMTFQTGDGQELAGVEKRYWLGIGVMYYLIKYSTVNLFFGTTVNFSYARWHRLNSFPYNSPEVEDQYYSANTLDYSFPLGVLIKLNRNIYLAMRTGCTYSTLVSKNANYNYHSIMPILGLDFCYRFNLKSP